MKRPIPHFATSHLKFLNFLGVSFLVNRTYETRVGRFHVCETEDKRHIPVCFQKINKTGIGRLKRTFRLKCPIQTFSAGPKKSRKRPRE